MGVSLAVQFIYKKIFLILLFACSTNCFALLPEICKLDPSQYYVTSAQEKDRLALIELAVDANERFNTCLMSKKYSRQILWIKPQQIKDGMVQMLRQHNCATILGFYSLDAEQQDLMQHRRELHLLFVHQDYNRYGLGSVLLKHAAEKARKLGTKILHLYSMPESEAFYIKHGAVRTSAIPNLYNPGTQVVLLDIAIIPHGAPIIGIRSEHIQYKRAP